MGVFGYCETYFNRADRQVCNPRADAAACYNERLSPAITYALALNLRVANAEAQVHPGLYQSAQGSQPSPVPYLRPILPRTISLGGGTGGGGR